MPETDLYLPVKRFLEEQGYTVKAEVHDCDVVGVRDAAMVIVELKASLNLTLLLQAVDRKDLTDHVYVAVPNGGALLTRQYRQVTRLLKLLGIGLLLVDTAGDRVDAALDPCEYRPRQRRKARTRLLKEHAELVGDPNTGGAARRTGRMTAYRQRALSVAAYLAANGPAKAAAVRDGLGEPKAYAILYRNVYGWFERRGKGIYALSPRGRTEHLRWT